MELVTGWLYGADYLEAASLHWQRAANRSILSPPFWGQAWSCLGDIACWLPLLLPCTMCITSHLLSMLSGAPWLVTVVRRQRGLCVCWD